MTSTLGKTSVLIVLPWSLDALGGVNEVVKSMVANAEGDTDLGLTIMVSQDAPERFERDGRPSMVRFPLYSPFEPTRRLRAAASFAVKAPVRLFQLWRLVNRLRVDVVNFHYPHLGCLYFVLLRNLRAFRGAIVLSFHLGDALNATASRGLERRCWSMALGFADRIVTVSRALQKELLAVNPAIEKKLITIHNGVDFGQFSRKHGELDQLPPHFAGRFIVMIVANFEERKGHDTLLEAFASIRHRLPNACVVHVGRTFPFLDKLRAQRDALSLQDDVAFVENVPHERVPIYLSHASLFVLPSRLEGFPLAILEAGAAGLPVIAARVPGVDEVIEDGVTGLLVDPGNVDALGRAIVELAEAPDRARRLADRFQEHIRQNLTWTEQYRRYVELFHDCGRPKRADRGETPDVHDSEATETRR
jgi:glycosyltransferase involved in cell wall biosynthesis